MASISKRVAKKTFEITPFQQGTIIKHTRQAPKNPAYEKAVIAEIKKFETSTGLMINGLVLDTDNGRCDFHGIFESVEENAELIALQIKMLADALHVNREKIIGKILSSLFEDEKGDDEDDET